MLKDFIVRNPQRPKTGNKRVARYVVEAMTIRHKDSSWSLEPGAWISKVTQAREVKSYVSARWVLDGDPHTDRILRDSPSMTDKLVLVLPYALVQRRSRSWNLVPQTCLT